MRELRNLIERIIYLSDSEKLDASDLQFSDALQKLTTVSPDFSGTLNDATREFQIQLIRSEIKRCRGNMTTVARQQLVFIAPNLYRKMGQLGMSLGSSVERLEMVLTLPPCRSIALGRIET